MKPWRRTEPTKLLTFNKATQGVELYSFHGIKRGSFWDITVVAGLGETNLGGTPADGVLTGMWR